MRRLRDWSAGPAPHLGSAVHPRRNRYAHQDGYKDEGIAFVLAWGVRLRPRDVAALEASHVDLKQEVVWVQRKGPLRAKVRYGSMEERPIVTSEALTLLTHLVARRPSGPLLPRFRERNANVIVHRVSSAESWDPNLLWDGIHNLSHGIAARTFREGILRTREVGSWRGADGLRRYGRQARVPPRK